MIPGRLDFHHLQLDICTQRGKQMSALDSLCMGWDLPTNAFCLIDL